jgi:diketogulonate reductase-like aldo/keto reductase
MSRIDFPSVMLNDGNRMPMFGLGTFRMSGQDAKRSVKFALKKGYRMIDTAAMYDNEVFVGKAIRESGLAREDVFITTKLWTSDEGYESAHKAFEKSLMNLGMDYVDLYLIHWPVKGRYMESWKAMTEIKLSGRARSIGVSNFQMHHLREILGHFDTPPAVNQVEFHPHLYQRELLDYCRNNGIEVTAWAPLMRGEVIGMEPIERLARKYGKTPPQIALRWNIQHGLIIIPKSVREERIIENSEIFDFELTDDEMKMIDALGTDRRLGPHPDRFSF